MLFCQLGCTLIKPSRQHLPAAFNKGLQVLKGLLSAADGVVARTIWVQMASEFGVCPKDIAF